MLSTSGWTFQSGSGRVTANGQDAIPNKSSCVLTVDMDEFVARMVEEDLGYPAFSVSDCNSFHTTGYLWATYAVRSAYRHGAKQSDSVALLNFDQHADAGQDW